MVTTWSPSAGSSHLRDKRPDRNITAVTRPIEADMACPRKASRPLDAAACRFAAPLKSHDRVKPLVTVASGFPATVRPLTRWPSVWIIFDELVIRSTGFIRQYARPRI